MNRLDSVGTMELRTKRINVPVSETELATFKRAAWRDARVLAEYVRRVLERQVTPEDRELAKKDLAEKKE